MKNSKRVLLTGIRGSKLSVTQASNAVKQLEKVFSELTFQLEKILSPGDRDRKLDLKLADNDFFTKDLDLAVINGDVECAIHSAKDLPYDLYADELKDEIDWFWLPWHEDSRDILVFNSEIIKKFNFTLTYENLKSKNNSPEPLTVGVSSEKRELFCKKLFPNAIMKPIRGDIENRIQQLDDGKYDVLIMAAAGLKRINLENRIDCYIPLSELRPAAGQGVLAVTFKKGNEIFNLIRKLFVQQLVFAGSGCGNVDYAPYATIKALKDCEVCLYDALMPEKLLEYIPEHAEKVFVGKRSGKHSMQQENITQLIIDYARQGKKVLRLKGGDPGFFGRLAEEIAQLDELQMPYRVIPAVSALQTATTSTGLLLTRRGISRGFTVATTRKAKCSGFAGFSDKELKTLSSVFFMGTAVLSEILDEMLERGFSKDEAVSIVFAAGTDNEKIISGTIDDIKEKAFSFIETTNLPGIIIVGPVAQEKFIYKQHGALGGKRILCTFSNILQDKAVASILNYGGIPVAYPMIDLEPVKDIEKQISESFADFYIFTSPTSVRIFMKKYLSLSLDIRKLPKLIVCGPGTSDAFKSYGIFPDIEPVENFGAEGLLDTVLEFIPQNVSIIRWCSDKASQKITQTLISQGYNIKDIVLYNNVMKKYSTIPEFDVCLFASTSAVEAFVENFGTESLKEKLSVVIGKPTFDALKKINQDMEIILSKKAVVESMIKSLAYKCISEQINLN